MATLQTHNIKFSKGDSLDSLAKKYGVKADEIWKHPGNKKIAQSRGKPDKLQAGDPLVIPPSDKDVQAALKSLDADMKVVTDEMARVTKRVAALDKAERDIKAAVEVTKSDFQAQISKINMAGNLTDLAATVVSLGRVVHGAMKKGVEGIEKTGEELKKHSKEVKKDAVNLATSPFKDVSVKVVGNSATSSDEAVEFVQITVKSFDKMMSPSFWTNTAYQLACGKSWSDSVTTNVTKELQDRLDELQAVELSQLNKLKRIRSGVLAHESQLAAAEKQLKSIAHDMK